MAKRTLHVKGNRNDRRTLSHGVKETKNAGQTPLQGARRGRTYSPRVTYQRDEKGNIGGGTGTHTEKERGKSWEVDDQVP